LHYEVANQTKCSGLAWPETGHSVWSSD